MPADPVVTVLEALRDEILREIAGLLTGGDLDVLDEYRPSATSLYTVPDPVDLVARAHTGSLLGWAHLLRSAGPGGRWTVDVLTGTPPDAAVVTALLLEARGHTKGNAAEWWVRPTTAGVLPQVHSAVDLIPGRRILRMERSLDDLPPTDSSLGLQKVEPDRADGSLAAAVAVNNAAFAGHVDRANATDDGVRAWLSRAPDLFLAPEGAGFVWLKALRGGRGEVYVLGVHPDHQGKGLGRQLLIAGLHYLASELGAEVAVLHVDESDHRAVALYERNGFVDVGQPLVSWMLGP